MVFVFNFVPTFLFCGAYKQHLMHLVPTPFNRYPFWAPTKSSAVFVFPNCAPWFICGLKIRNPHIILGTQEHLFGGEDGIVLLFYFCCVRGVYLWLFLCTYLVFLFFVLVGSGGLALFFLLRPLLGCDWGRGGSALGGPPRCGLDGVGRLAGLCATGHLCDVPGVRFLGVLMFGLFSIFARFVSSVMSLCAVPSHQSWPIVSPPGLGHLPSTLLGHIFRRTRYANCFPPVPHLVCFPKKS